MPADRYRVGSFEFTSRLFAGTGKYADFEIMKSALAASECEVVTVAVRRDVLTPDGKPVDGALVRPVKVTYVWEENGAPKKDVHITKGLPETYKINCATKPQMKSVIVELAD